MTYIWQIENEYPESLICEFNRNKGIDRFIFKKGKSIECSLTDLEFSSLAKVSELRKLNDIANNALVPLVSPQVQDILMAKCPSDIQLISAKIICGDGLITDYKVLNCTKSLSVIDSKKSDFSLIPGTDAIMSFRHVIAKPWQDSGISIARCKEYMSYLAVNENLFKPLSERVNGAELIAMET